MEKRLSLFIILAASASVAHAQVLYNGLGLPISSSYASTDGGSTTFSGQTYGGEVGQLITASGDVNEISSVESYYDSFIGWNAGPTSHDTALLVQVFNFSNGAVGSEVGQQLVTSFSEVDSLIQSTNYDFNGAFQYDVTANVAIGGIVSGSQYLVTMQAQSPYWEWLGVSYDGNQDMYVRDYSSFGAKGIYGVTTWTSTTNASAGLQLEAGDTQMKITGASVPAPEPASLGLVAAGAAALLKRRKGAR